jgi:peptidase S24-like protein
MFRLRLVRDCLSVVEIRERMQQAPIPALQRAGVVTPDSLRPRATFPDRCATLIIDLLREGQPVVFRARGASMWPAIPDGSLIEVRPCAPRAVAEGSLVAFERAGAVVVHRVVAASADGLELRGDALGRSDDVVSYARVLGCARVIERRRPRFRLPSAREAGVLGRALWRRVRVRVRAFVL